MYLPAAFTVDDPAEILAVLRGIGFGHLVTHSAPEGETAAFKSSALPFVVDNELSTIRAHFARANDHWKQVHECDGLLIVPSVDSYISPRLYPSKAEHGKVVPTWNYEVVHLHGTIEIHDEDEWKLKIVEDLTNLHENRAAESGETQAWRVSDAPADYIRARLKGIVGVQLHVTRLEAKRKLSQNRDDADRLGVARGLDRSGKPGDRDTAALMDSLPRD